MKDGTATSIAEDEINTIKFAGSRCRGGLTLIELLIMIAMSSRRGVCASESFADLAERPAIGGHTLGPLLVFLFASALSANGGPAGPQFSVQDLGPLEATFISNDGRVLGDDSGGGSSWLWTNGERVRLNLYGASAVNRNGYVVGHVYAGTYRTAFGDDMRERTG